MFNVLPTAHTSSLRVNLLDSIGSQIVHRIPGHIPEPRIDAFADDVDLGYLSKKYAYASGGDGPHGPFTVINGGTQEVQSSTEDVPVELGENVIIELLKSNRDYKDIVEFALGQSLDGETIDEIVNGVRDVIHLLETGEYSEGGASLHDLIPVGIYNRHSSRFSKSILIDSLWPTVLKGLVPSIAFASGGVFSLGLIGSILFETELLIAALTVNIYSGFGMIAVLPAMFFIHFAVERQNAVLGFLAGEPVSKHLIGDSTKQTLIDLAVQELNHDIEAITKETKRWKEHIQGDERILTDLMGHIQGHYRKLKSYHSFHFRIFNNNPNLHEYPGIQKKLLEIKDTVESFWQEFCDLHDELEAQEEFMSRLSDYVDRVSKYQATLIETAAALHQYIFDQAKRRG